MGGLRAFFFGAPADRQISQIVVAMLRSEGLVDLAAQKQHQNSLVIECCVGGVGSRVVDAHARVLQAQELRKTNLLWPSAS